MKKLTCFLIAAIFIINCSAKSLKLSSTESYPGDTLIIESFCLANKDSMFKAHNFDRTIDDLYFVLYNSYYVLYIPEMDTFYYVKSKLKQSKIIGEHLISTITILRTLKLQQNGIIRR